MYAREIICVRKSVYVYAREIWLFNGGPDLYLTRWRVRRSCRSLGDEVLRVMTLQNSLKYSGAQVASTEWSVEASVAECDFTEWTAQGQTVHLR